MFKQSESSSERHFVSYTVQFWRFYKTKWQISRKFRNIDRGDVFFFFLLLENRFSCELYTSAIFPWPHKTHFVCYALTCANFCSTHRDVNLAVSNCKEGKQCSVWFLVQAAKNPKFFQRVSRHNFLGYIYRTLTIVTQPWCCVSYTSDIKTEIWLRLWPKKTTVRNGNPSFIQKKYA